MSYIQYSTINNLTEVNNIMYTEIKTVKKSFYNEKAVIAYFNSLSEILNYIDTSKTKHSDDYDFEQNFKNIADYKLMQKFNLVENYEEATKLAKIGWEKGKENIKNLLDTKYNINADSVKTKPEYSIAGYQCSVPRYLQGIPTNMINSKRVPAKQKTMTVVKHIGFSADVSTDTIIDNSAKSLAIVQKLESQGVRCNLDIISPVTTPNGKQVLTIRVRIKNSTEKLNLGVIAFALSHPDMLRRIIFAARVCIAFDENIPDIRKTAFIHTAGSSIYSREVITEEFLKPGEKYLHNFISSVDEEVEKFNKI